MDLALYQVDAFASGVFKGNPAAVVPLDEWLADETLQAIAAENNLAETAYFIPKGDGWHLRWFTPEFEMDLCGHATLASAWVIANVLQPGRERMSFETRSGELVVERDGYLLRMDFPARPPGPVDSKDAVAAALGGKPVEILASRDYFVVYETAAEVEALQPNMQKLMDIDRFGFIATAKGDPGCDFVSRFFAPKAGIPEDPVTGSAHCSLIPYWAEKLNKHELFARQVSRRGGDLWCQFKGDRVGIAGRCVPYLRGTISV